METTLRLGLLAMLLALLPVSREARAEDLPLERSDPCSRFEDGERYPVLVRRAPGRKDATFFVRAGWVVNLETGRCFRTPPDLERLVESAEKLASGTGR